ncbi:hypothetical protein H5V45_14640 [Nocardioides sp. KIGAM211]|uniref:Ig-like domain-containing protein n=1 Tax=Nocardioides luti TaxID=2761101 RepID=A0A7X0VBM1_9ACTN|nr:hypothetical protein [Nocardioides luti]MBB6628560.1 hypothetical protein [Nocardioides luti]
MARSPRARRAQRAGARARLAGVVSLVGVVGLAMTAAGLGTAPPARADTAPHPSAVRAAATTGAATPASRQLAALRPTAIGVDGRGTSYVGFAAGGALARYSADGERRRPLPLDRDGAVVGLHATRRGSVWVAYADGVSLLRPGGHVARRLDTGTCPDGTARDPDRYGGVTATWWATYVADPCAPRLLVFGPDGDRIAVVHLPGSRPARGLAATAGEGGHGPRLYVTLPDRAALLAYGLRRDRPGRHPVDRVVLRRPAGGVRPVPAGVTVDRFGQVVVADAANNALYFLDSHHGYSLYRTLGHPPRRSHRAGRLSHPTALAQHAQDGSGLSGNLFIADGDNYRIQRWDTGGYTHWAHRVHAPRSTGGGGSGGNGGGNGNGGGTGGGGGSGGGEPANFDLPVVVGTPEVGQLLSCSHGGWSPAPTSYEYGWLRDGVLQDAGEDGVYDVPAADAGHSIACRVRATNADGTSGWVHSDSVDVSAAGSS